MRDKRSCSDPGFSFAGQLQLNFNSNATADQPCTVSPFRPEPTPRKWVLPVSGSGHGNQPDCGTGCSVTSKVQITEDHNETEV